MTDSKANPLLEGGLLFFLYLKGSAKSVTIKTISITV